MASRHMKWEFGTKLCYLQGIRARQSARYIDGMMRAQKPNNVGTLANLIKVSAKSQITIAQHSLDSSAPDTNFIQKIWFSQPSDQDESLFFSASDLLLQLSPRITVFCYRMVQWMVIRRNKFKFYFVNSVKKALQWRQQIIFLENGSKMTFIWLRMSYGWIILSD